MAGSVSTLVGTAGESEPDRILVRLVCQAQAFHLVAGSLVPDMIHPEPSLHGCIKPVNDDGTICFQSFHKTALAGTVVPDQDSERRELDSPTLLDCLEVLQRESSSRKVLDFI